MVRKSLPITNNIPLFTVTDSVPNGHAFKSKAMRTQSIATDADIDGFRVICIFHQLFGLPYYDLKTRRWRSFFGIVCSFIFMTIFIASLIPCVLVCDEGSATRYKSVRINRSRSACIVQIILIGVEAYHTIDNDLGLIYARHEFRHFYKFLNNIVVTYKLCLTRSLKRRLLVTAWILIVLNIIHAIIEIIFLWPIVTEEIQEQTSPQKALLEMPKGMAIGVMLVIKVYGSIHSKAADTLMIYFSLLLTYYMRCFGTLAKDAVELAEDLNSGPSNHSLEELRQLFVSLQELVTKVNNCLSPSLFLTTTCNIIAVMGGIFVGIDLFGQGAKVEEEEAFDVFNAVVSLLSLLVCSIFSDNIKSETMTALRHLQRIRFNKIDDSDCRSVKSLIDYLEGSRVECLTGTGFFSFDKRFLYWIWLIIIPYTVLLSQKY